jgi:hypothetical protein
MYWIIGRKSKLSLENKLLIYKTILKPIWTYGISLWGTASNSNIEIRQRFQNKFLRSIVNALWYVKRVKGKAIPLQAWTGPEVSRRLRLPDLKTFST